MPQEEKREIEFNFHQFTQIMREIKRIADALESINKAVENISSKTQ